MTVDLVIPALRQREVERLVYSLEHQTRPPDLVTVVSNEVAPFPSSKLDVRVVRFEATIYAVGHKDVALRQNVGIFESEADHIIISGDDQIAPPTMVADTLTRLEEKPYVWGNHRIQSFGNKTVDEIRLTPMESGVSREHPPNHRHAAQSCYGGMFGIRRLLLWDMGGFDMAFMCRHAGEDQQLGHRLNVRHNERAAFIAEPPFSWMDGSRPPWGSIRVTNVCGNHQLETRHYGGLPFHVCGRCPYLVYAGVEGALFRQSDRPIIEYDHGRVTTRSERWQQP